MTIPQTKSRRSLPDIGIGGIVDAMLLPDESLMSSWDDIVLPSDMKSNLLRNVIASVRLRAKMPRTKLPLHGIVLLTGAPGVGKTTLARGLANRIAASLSGKQWMFVEIDPHALASSSLGRSQRAVEQLFSEILNEHAGVGPLIVLIDEVETLVASRADLSMDANPIDVHRSVDAALVGLDRLARDHPDLVIIATSNFPKAVDEAFKSRADQVIEVPLPDEPARFKILSETVAGVAEAFDNPELADPAGLARAAAAGDGMDARRLRKAVAEACGLRPDAKGDPANVTIADLVSVIERQARS